MDREQPKSGQPDVPGPVRLQPGPQRVLRQHFRVGQEGAADAAYDGGRRVVQQRRHALGGRGSQRA
ncbi:hypothetical protein ACFW4X_25445 [Streptomyces smyrnaeus]|uniref:hypothetical protein n=1 Tax=Streptomyces smyrnaeus TaxID=1387713 RepID=UPI00368E514B